GQLLWRDALYLRRLERGQHRVGRGTFRERRHSLDEAGAKGARPAQRNSQLDLDRCDLLRRAQASELANTRIEVVCEARREQLQHVVTPGGGVSVTDRHVDSG